MTLSRRAFLSISAAAPVAAALGTGTRLGAAGRHAATQRPAITPVFAPLRDDVGYFTGRGGTIGYLINKDAVIVVDSQYPDSAALCVSGLQQRAGDRGVDVLINTHHHADHTGGNLVFKPVTKKGVINHRAAELQQQVYDDTAKAAAAGGRPAPAEIWVPGVTFTETWTERAGGETVTAMTYTPAHTGGDAIVHFEKANVVHMGDLLWNRVHPVIDRPAGASIQTWIAKLEAIAKTFGGDTTYIVGHANAKFPVTCSRADVLMMRDYLTALLAFVGQQIKAGKTREQVLAMTDTIAGFEDFGPLVQRPLPAAFDELTAGKGAPLAQR